MRTKVLDEDLPIERPKVQEILRNGHAEYAWLFDMEERRKVPLQCDEGQHLELDEEKSHSVIIGRDLNSDLVEPSKWSTILFPMHCMPDSCNPPAMKIMRTKQLRDTLEKRTRRLKHMRHIRSVQLVNSYRRERAADLLLRPVAHTDLKRLVVRYRENEFDPIRDCKNREWIRPVFENAFRC